jgi:sigma-B regulation protein RsbU (phosphoserine phosphatase)
VLVRDGQVEELQVEGMPLGMFPEVKHEPLEFQLRPDDLVVIFSDGIYEPIDHNREEFGARKLRALLVQNAERSAQEIADEVLRSTELYVRDSADADDRTVVVLKVL